MKQFFLTLGVLLTSGVCLAESVGKKAADNSPEAEMASFNIHEDFEINLFADESMGIANPVAMNWDDKGRLWVLTTLTYAQLEPGQTVNDTLVILEDTDQDGKADKSTVFAEGLDMPMGFALGFGGVYLGEGPDLLFLKDTDGDDKADSREVVLTGFGTGDTHQNISNFTWGPDGLLYFCQGLHCYSRVETPWGIVRGDTAGFFRFNPRTLRLEPFCFPSMASQNPCGMAFDKDGALFIKSNNRELIYVTPGMVPTTRPKNLVPIASIGATPGKSMGAEYVDSPHLPDWLQDHILVAGYYANRVTAFPLKREGAGFSRVEPVELLRSDHTSFRPVEIKNGPDGAIYIADWFNPIIGHYQASLRHPDRDKEHGRIWRMTAKGRDLSKGHRSGFDPELPNDLQDKLGVGTIQSFATDPNPRVRLSLILKAAQIGTATAFVDALHVLDHPRDRFIDYALEQTVHAVAPRWIDALKKGSIAFAKPEHLAYALSVYGGPEVVEFARTEMAKPNLDSETRAALGEVLASHGNAKDYAKLMADPATGSAILSALADAQAGRKVKPSGDVAPLLLKLLKNGNEEEKVQAVRLTGLWRVNSMAGEIRKLMADDAGSQSLRAEAVRALVQLEDPGKVDAILDLLGEGDSAIRSAAADALVVLAPERAARAVAPHLADSKDAADVKPLLLAFLNRKGGIKHLGAALKKEELSEETAALIASTLGSLGRNDSELLGVLHDRMGKVAGARAYSPDFVAALMKEVKDSGDPASGKEIYGRAQLACVTCHQVEKVGGVIGPSLDAVGAGLSTDLLIESVLWPERQLKEGYFAISVTTKAGDTYSGYREKEENGVLHLRDTASGVVRVLPRLEISKTENIGTVMPVGLTATLSREELRDLIAYLASLRG